MANKIEEAMERVHGKREEAKENYRKEGSKEFFKRKYKESGGSKRLEKMGIPKGIIKKDYQK